MMPDEVIATEGGIPGPARSWFWAPARRKLTPALARRIRVRYDSMPNREIAAILGVSAALVSQVGRGVYPYPAIVTKARRCRAKSR